MKAVKVTIGMVLAVALAFLLMAIFDPVYADTVPEFNHAHCLLHVGCDDCLTFFIPAGAAASHYCNFDALCGLQSDPNGNGQDEQMTVCVRNETDEEDVCNWDTGEDSGACIDMNAWLCGCTTQENPDYCPINDEGYPECVCSGDPDELNFQYRQETICVSD